MARQPLTSLLAAGLAGCAVYVPSAERLWPFPGATGIDPDTRIRVQHSYLEDTDPYGIERVYALRGPSGEVAWEASFDDGLTLAITPLATLETGDHALDVHEGTDSNAFTSTYHLPWSLEGEWPFSTASAPLPLCQTWYDSGWRGAAQYWEEGRTLCLHFSEPLQPGGVDLALGQLWIAGEPFKASGVTPDPFPELLCLLTPNALEPTDWELTLRPDDVIAQAGGSFETEVTVVQGDLPSCHDLPFVLPRWRPDEDNSAG